MGSQQRQRKQQRSVRNRQLSGGNTGMRRSTHVATKASQVTPGAPLPSSSEAVEQADVLTALDFATIARRLTLATRRRGLVCPLFRSPPDLPGTSRSLRHNHDGSVTVSVVVRGRHRLAVLADMIDGVVAANALEFGDASTVRDALWVSIPAEVTVADSGASVGAGIEVERPAGSLAARTVNPVAA